MKLTGENRSTLGKKTCPIATLSAKNLTRTPGVFLSCPVFSPLIHFVLLNPSVLLHVTLCSILVLI
jgi:hypothetical protein